MDPALALTPDEDAELSRPAEAALDPDRLARRRAIARKLFAQVCAAGWWAAWPAPVRAAYEDRPPWAFYSSPKGRGAYRVYAAYEYMDGTFGYHVVSARPGRVAILSRPLRAAQLVSVEEWTARQRALIEGCSEPGVFFDPCAWVRLAEHGT